MSNPIPGDPRHDWRPVAREVRFGERCVEVSLNEMIHRQVEMRHPQPPALSWMSAQEVHGRAPMRDAISSVAGPVALERQQTVRLAERQHQPGGEDDED